jgi:hypothetical protein
VADSAEEPRRGLLQAAASLDVRVLAFSRKKVGRTLEADNESCRLRRMQTRFSSALVPVGSSRRALQRMVKSPIVAALQSPTDAERSCWPRPARIAWPPPVERPMTARRSRWERVRNVAVAFARPFFRRGLDSARCKEAPAHGRRRIRGGVAGRGPVVRSREWVAPGAGAVTMAIRGRVMRSPAAVSLALVRLREDASLPASEAPASGKSLRV